MVEPNDKRMCCCSLTRKICPSLFFAAGRVQCLLLLDICQRVTEKRRVTVMMDEGFVFLLQVEPVLAPTRLSSQRSILDSIKCRRQPFCMPRGMQKCEAKWFNVAV